MRANRFISEEEFKDMEHRVMTANQRYRARLRGESVPLRKHRWTKKEDVLIRHAYANLKRGDGQMAQLVEELKSSPDKIQARAATLGLTNPARELADDLRTRLSHDRTDALRLSPQDFTRPMSRSGGRSTAGHREDLNGQYFRSAWEANYARYLNFSGIKWEYEKKTFWFESIRRGVRSYTPDFYLPDQLVYHEVKGWMDKKSATKLKRMKKYYPESVVVVIGREFFKTANQQGLCRLVPGWECNHKKHRGIAPPPQSEATRAKRIQTMKGRPLSQAHLAALRYAAIQRKYAK